MQLAGWTAPSCMRRLSPAVPFQHGQDSLTLTAHCIGKRKMRRATTWLAMQQFWGMTYSSRSCPGFSFSRNKNRQAVRTLAQRNDAAHTDMQTQRRTISKSQPSSPHPITSIVAAHRRPPKMNAGLRTRRVRTPKIDPTTLQFPPPPPPQPPFSSLSPQHPLQHPPTHSPIALHGQQRILHIGPASFRD